MYFELILHAFRQSLGILSKGHALFFPRYESCIDAEIQQRAVEYFALSRKGAALMYIMAEMSKFPECQVQVLNHLHAVRYSLFCWISSSIFFVKGPIFIVQVMAMLKEQFFTLCRDMLA